MNNTITFLHNDFSREQKSFGLLFASGLIATVLMVLVSLLSKAVQTDLYQADPASLYASLFTGSAVSMLFSTRWWLGLAFHMLIATLLLPLVFGYFARRYELSERSWMKGFVFGALIWISVEALFKPLAGFGFFSRGLAYPFHETGFSLALWLIYGVVLNALAKVPTAHAFEVSYRDAA